MPASPDPGMPPERPQVPHPPRPPRPPRPPGSRDGAPDVLPPGAEPVDDVVGALLGEPRTMRRRQVSAAAEVSLLSARRFWHALGFPNVGDEDTVFTAADLQALRSVVGLVREGVFDETTALSMIRALGRTTDRLAMWQTQLMAEALGDLPEVDAWTGLLGAGGASSDTSRAVPDPETARAAALTCRRRMVRGSPSSAPATSSTGSVPRGSTSGAPSRPPGGRGGRGGRGGGGGGGGTC